MYLFIALFKSFSEYFSTVSRKSFAFPQENFSFACKELKSVASKRKVSLGNANILRVNANFLFFLVYFHHYVPLGAP